MVPVQVQVWVGLRGQAASEPWRWLAWRPQRTARGWRRRGRAGTSRRRSGRPAQPPAAAGAGWVQRRAVLEFLPYLDQFEGARAGVPLLRPPVPAGAVPMPAQVGVVQPGRARRPPLHRLRGAQQLDADPQLADAAAGPPAEAGARGSCGGRASGDGCSGA